MSLEVRGYSERGMINALFYEMKYSEDPCGCLREVLHLCHFPAAERCGNVPAFKNKIIKKAKITIEQSFSDFGDLDVLLLLELDDSSNLAVFLEAKVKTFQDNWGTITAEWERFDELVRSHKPTLETTKARSRSKSNLFVQLYRKGRLVTRLTSDENLASDCIAGRWSIGDNGVVQNAADELRSYCNDPWFVALVPDRKGSLKRFFGDLAPQPLPDNLRALDTSRWGYMSWSDLHRHCENIGGSPRLEETCKNFEYNCGQIYDREAHEETVNQAGDTRAPSGVSLVRLKEEFAQRHGGFPNPPDTFVYFSWNSKGSSYLRNYYSLPMTERWFRADDVFKFIRDEVTYSKQERHAYNDEAWWRDETHRRNQQRPRGEPGHSEQP